MYRVQRVVCIEQERVQLAAFCELQCVQCAVCAAYSFQSACSVQCAVQCVVCCVHCELWSVLCAVCSLQCALAATAPASALSEQRELPPNPTDEMISKLFVIFPAVAAPAKKRWHLIGNLLGLRGQWTCSADAVHILLTNVSSNIS